MTAEGHSEAGPTDDSCEESNDEEPDGARDHLRDVPVGSGCTEIWEHLAERREDDG